MKLPSIKIILVAITCVAVVSAIYVLIQKNNKTEINSVTTNTLSPELVSSSVKGSAYIDSDKDGLYDWEEIIWKTDPLNPDTDQDGILDGEDVKKTPSFDTATQKLTKTDGVNDINTQTDSPQNLTLTDKIAQAAFTQYALLKQSGKKITADQAQEIAHNIIANQPLVEGLKKFTELNIPNKVENSSDNIYTYGNEVWDIMVKDTPKNVKLENEYTILLTALQKEDEKYLEKLDPIILGYQNTIKDLLSMKVPAGAVSAHLNFVNNMNGVLAFIEDMRAYYKDTARGLGAVTYYGGQVIELRASLTQLVEYFSSQGVEYVEGESGYLLTHSI